MDGTCRRRRAPVRRASRLRHVRFATAALAFLAVAVVAVPGSVVAQDERAPSDRYEVAVRELLETAAGRAFLEAYIAVRRDYLYGAEVDELLEGAAAGLVDALDDPLSRYLDPESASALRAAVAAGGVEVAQLGDAALIRISSFEGDLVGARFTLALDTLLASGARGFVLDLRGNEGGSILQGLQVLDRFLGDGELGFRRVRGVSVPIAYANPRSIPHPLVVLVDDRTSSTAEIVAGTLQSYGRARLVGTPTAGKGVGQTAIRLADGAELRLVTFEWLLPGLRSIDGVGLTPDVWVTTAQPDPIKGDEGPPLVALPDEGGDPALRIGLEALRALLGDELDVAGPTRPAPTTRPPPTPTAPADPGAAQPPIGPAPGPRDDERDPEDGAPAADGPVAGDGGPVLAADEADENGGFVPHADNGGP